MSKVYEVKSHILGFEGVTSVEVEVIDDFFATLKDSKTGEDLFTLVNPFALKDYEFEMPTSLKVLLDANEGSTLNAYCVVVLQNPINKSKINFLAPLIFNEDNSTMGQLVLSSKEYLHLGFAEDISQFVA
jgi:flagellar assembly factor FliW